MKKAVSIFLSVMLLITAFLVPDYEEFYASGSLSMSVSSSSVIIGDTVTATISVPSGYGAQVDIHFSSGILSYIEASTSNVNVTNVGNGQVSLNMYEALGTSKVTVKFKAVSSGTAGITADVVKAGDENGEPVTLGGASKSITVANQAVQNPEKSDDNSLENLKISGGILSPEFQYSVTEYTSTVEHSITRVDVTAKTSNEKAIIESMSGNENLKVGENLITIVVKAENGEKAVYKIWVTRKEQAGEQDNSEDQTGNDSTESESNTDDNTENNTQDNTEIIIEGADSGFTWNGAAQLFTETIPTEMIPSDFSIETMMFNNMEIPCLNFNKGSMTLLYLKTAEGNSGLYVYDKTEESIYPFIRLQSNDRYIIILQPEELSAPNGYEMCSFSMEGKGVVTGCRYTEEAFLDFYLVYCVNNEGNQEWYQYDAAEGTFQRYAGTMVMEPSTEVDKTPSGDSSDASNYELEAELKETQDKSRMMLCVFVFVVVVLLVVIVNLILNRRRDEDDEDEEYEEDEYEYEYEYEYEENLECEENPKSEDDTKHTEQMAEDDSAIEDIYKEKKSEETAVDSVIEGGLNEDVEIKLDNKQDETAAEKEDDLEVEFQKLSQKLMETSDHDDDLEFIDL